MKDTLILIALIMFCLYFGITVTFSPAPLWLVIPVDIVFCIIILACIDATLAIRYNNREGRS